MAIEKKQIDIPKVINYLSHAFSNATQKAGKTIGYVNVAGTDLHQHQVDFAHLVNEIQRGPKNFLPKRISEANELIERINESV